MIHPIKTFGAALAAVAIGALAINPVSARERVRAGTLACDISPGFGLIVGSQKNVTCTFSPSQRGPREAYRGTINKIGLDIGGTTGGKMVWAVYAPTSRGYGALAGSYGGANVEGTVGVGAGANFLVGGSNRTITLQPISVQGQTGLNLAAGVAGLGLHSARHVSRTKRHASR
jgi:Protein of unknown function (DUF992)